MVIQFCEHGPFLWTWSILVNMVHSCEHGPFLWTWCILVNKVHSCEHGAFLWTWCILMNMVHSGEHGPFLWTWSILVNMVHSCEHVPFLWTWSILVNMVQIFFLCWTCHLKLFRALNSILLLFLVSTVHSYEHNAYLVVIVNWFDQSELGTFYFQSSQTGKKKGQKGAVKKKNSKSKNPSTQLKKVGKKNGQPYGGNDLTSKLLQTMEKHKEVSYFCIVPMLIVSVEKQTPLINAPTTKSSYSSSTLTSHATRMRRRAFVLAFVRPLVTFLLVHQLRKNRGFPWIDFHGRLPIFPGFLCNSITHCSADGKPAPCPGPGPFHIQRPDGRRDAFLTMAREKHLEFSSLRRAKFSTMAMLYELHITGRDGFVYTCNSCKVNMETHYHCNTCDVSLWKFCWQI